MRSLLQIFSFGLICLLLIASSDAAVNGSLGGGGFGAFFGAPMADQQALSAQATLIQHPPTARVTETLNVFGASGATLTDPRNEAYDNAALGGARIGYGRSVRSLVAAQSSSIVNVSPSSYQTPDAGDTLAVNGISNTGHGSTLTSASAADIESQPSKNITQMRSARWSSFQSGSSGVIIGLKLKFDWTASGNVDASVEAGGSASARIDFNIDYSIDGGSSWTNALSRFRVVNQSGNGGKTDNISDGGSVEVVLSPSQNISLFQVRDFMRSNAVANAPSVSGAAANSSARITTSVSSVSLEVEVVNCVASVPAGQWKGEYYSNTNLAGSPAMVRNDGDGFLSLNFGTGIPGSGCGLGEDYFSARWSRTVNLASGIYRFSVTGDDGVRLYVDGQLVINKWFIQAATTYTANVTLSSTGPHQVTLEYFESSGPAVAILSWTLVTVFNCLPDVPLIGNAPRIGGGESIAATPVSGATKPCGQKKSD